MTIRSTIGSILGAIVFIWLASLVLHADPVTDADAIANPVTVSTSERRAELMQEVGLKQVPYFARNTPAFVANLRIERKEAAGIPVTDAEYLSFFRLCRGQ